MLVADAQAPFFEHVTDACHRAEGGIAHQADDGVCLVDQHPGAHLEVGRIYPWIDVGVVLGTAHEDGGDARLWRTQEDAHAIGGRRDLLQRRLQLYQRPPGFVKSDLAVHQLTAQLVEHGSRRIVLGETQQNLIDEPDGLVVVAVVRIGGLGAGLRILPGFPVTDSVTSETVVAVLCHASRSLPG